MAQQDLCSPAAALPRLGRVARLGTGKWQRKMVSPPQFSLELLVGFKNSTWLLVCAFCSNCAIDVWKNGSCLICAKYCFNFHKFPADFPKMHSKFSISFVIVATQNFFPDNVFFYFPASALILIFSLWLCSV